MQPYFFPYIGYWQLMFNCDVWVFFDSGQYNKKSWMSRNRILHSDPGKEFQYIGVPIRKHAKGTRIGDVTINNDEKWREKLIGQLGVYRRMRAPHYAAVMSLVKNVIASDDDSFCRLIVRSAEAVGEYLGQKTDFKRSSELDIDEGKINAAGEWALEISKMLGADEYINPPGGAEIFDENKYISQGIDLMFLEPKLSPYKQSRREYCPGLSIIDVMMFLDPGEIMKMIKRDFAFCAKNELAK